jgi:hypothetical protein
MAEEYEKPDVLIRHYEKLKSDRANFESTWQDIADYMRPVRGDFNVKRSPGERRNQKVFDSTALFSVENFAGGMFGMMTNPANRWFSLKVEDDELNQYDPVADWLWECENRLLYSFGPQVSRFYSAAPALYADLACFGNGVFYSEEIEGTGRINDNVRPLSECVIAENAYGVIDTVYRKFETTGRQAAQQFGYEALSDKLKKRIEKDPFCSVCILHCVKPNDDFEPEKFGTKRFRFQSVYIEMDERHVLKRGGYYDMPYQVPRWMQAAGEVYGRGLGDNALADVKMLNRMDETAIKAAQKVADPPMAAPDEGVIKQARTYPGGMTYGAIDMEGRQLLKPLITGANMNITLEMMDQRREAIKEAFFFSLMQMVQKGEMTATEWMGRQEEKLRLLGPNLGRLQNDLLSPLIKRRFGILARAQVLPVPPLEIQGTRLTIEYVSPLARAQRSGEANAVIRTYQGIMPIAEFDPSVLDNFDADQAARAVGTGFSVPAPVLRGAEQVAEIRAQRAQQAAQMQAMQAAQVGAGAMKDTAAAAKDASLSREIQARTAGGQEAQPGASAAPPQAQGAGAGGNVASIIDQLRTALQGRR